jgi:hypothetical protein
LAERWRKPAEVLSIEPASDQGLWLPDGRVQGEVELTLSRETVERMRAGYMCAKCLEPFEQAWPERCHVCGAPIRTDQAQYFAREYAGMEQLGPRTSLDEELAGLHERVEEEERNGK